MLPHPAKRLSWQVEVVPLFQKQVLSRAPEQAQAELKPEQDLTWHLLLVVDHSQFESALQTPDVK